MGEDTRVKESEGEAVSRRMTDALNEAVGSFISFSEGTFEEILCKGLRPIADAANIGRIVFFQSQTTDEKNLFIQKRTYDLLFLDTSNINKSTKFQQHFFSGF